MAVQLDVSLTREGAEAIARFSAFPARLLPTLARGLDTGLELALARTTATRFVGKGPFPVADKRLGIVTRRLSTSLRRSAAVISGDTISARIGTNVKYFGIHEFGFNGTVAVRAHARVRVYAAEPTRNARGRLVKNTREVSGQVRAHQRRVNVTAREPLKTGLSENAGLIGRSISAALTREISSGGAGR
jgi:phage gpG-like protein